MKERVLILGAGGLGRAIHEAFVSRGDYEVIGFLDDGKRGNFCELPVLGSIRDAVAMAEKHKATHVIVALGFHYQTQRQNIFANLSAAKLSFANAIHRDAKMARDVKLGRGIFIGMNVSINAGAIIGDNSVIWTGAIIEHDNKIGKNVFMATGAMTAGYVVIEDNVFVGMGAKIAKAHIGANATIGAGSLVLGDVEANTYVKGIPAKFSATKKESTYLFSS